MIVELDDARLPDPPNYDADSAGLQLRFESIADIAARIDAQGPPSWLWRGIWPADAYGVLAAEDKAGKSWAAGDAAVSVASGTPWLTVYDCELPGAVLLLAGEGGERNLLRRLRAIARARSLQVEQLDLRVLCRVPHLTNPEHLRAVAGELTNHPARLVILDPLYLAARGANGSDLYAMGETLEGLQHVCQKAGAALLVVTHFKKTGGSRGAKQITGVGPGAWGRVLVTADVEQRAKDSDGATAVDLAIEMIGGEIPDTSLRIRRRIWSDDPDDLAAPLNYAVEVLADEESGSDSSTHGLTPAARRVLALLTTELKTRVQIGDEVAGMGWPLKGRTIQDACATLVERGLADKIRIGDRGTLAWRLPENPEPHDHA